ncbi:MAG: helix-turn-helix transcriptional regulator [Acetobacteraceae bacterium]|nr:helix-turn-helix transcriptional regulator [Acetobacteraceae bacterium]
MSDPNSASATSLLDADDQASLGEARDFDGECRSGGRASLTDRHVGARIRERRVMLGLSQQQLAQMIGVTYQQAHKYERGLNRISAGRLFEIAQGLSVPVSWFFEGLATDTRAAEITQRQRMCLELARNFAAIDNEKHQEALSQMARALAAQNEREGLA